MDTNKDTKSRVDAQNSLASLRHLCRGVLAVPFGSGWASYKALASLLAGHSATEQYFSSSALARGIGDWAAKIHFDAVFAFSSGIAPLALSVPADRHVLCMDDLDSCKWLDLAGPANWPARLIYGTEARRLAVRELEWIDRFDATLMISNREADLVSNPRLRAKVHVFPPILPSVPESTPVCAKSHKKGAAAARPVVGFVGAMDYEPNIDAACWLAREIWPRVRRCCPEARLWIVGRSPTQLVRDLADDASIIVTGTVPDVNDYFRQMRMHVAPLRIARGVQMKVLAGMAAGRPCVVTSAVAEGIGAEAGREYLVADSSAMFAQCIINLLEHESRAQAIGRAGYAFLKRLRPEQAIADLEVLLGGEQVLERSEANVDIMPEESAMHLHKCVSVC
jgi:sugar transferase (PEP-CTERM/EpsH1 system associated)